MTNPSPSPSREILNGRNCPLEKGFGLGAVGEIEAFGDAAGITQRYAECLGSPGSPCCAAIGLQLVRNAAVGREVIVIGPTRQFPVQASGSYWLPLICIGSSRLG